MYIKYKSHYAIPYCAAISKYTQNKFRQLHQNLYHGREYNDLLFAAPSIK